MNNEEVKPVLLAVLAHPDDETFGIGGTLALYASRGVDVHLVCATRGEAGEVDPELLEGFDSVAERRVYELRCAAQILGLAGVHFLDYRDSGMPNSQDNQHPRALAAVPVEEVAAHVVETIRRLKPQVVVTSDPIGGYKHPDHIAVHKATVMAFFLASDPSFKSELPVFQPKKLYYTLIPKRHLRMVMRIMPLFGMDPHRFGSNKDVDLWELVKEGDFPVHAEIDYQSVADKRADATACHASQLGGAQLRRGPVGWFLRWLNRKESFMRAYPPAESGLQEDDLFAGV